MDPRAELQTLEKGGLWSDSNIEQSLDWQGERASSSPPAAPSIPLLPKTAKEQEKEILNAADISPDVLNVIVTRVAAQIAKNNGADGQTVVQVVESRMDKYNKTVQTWIDSLSKRVSDSEARLKDYDSNQIARLDEKIATLELKVDTIVSSVTAHGVEELELIHESHKIIMDRKAQDEPDDSTSGPSIYNRLNQRAGILETQLKNLEPIFESSAQNMVTQRKNVVQTKKKFGKLF